MAAARWRGRRRTPERADSSGRLDVYLLPAVVGGGWGDIAEVLDAGRTLAGAGFSSTLYRAPGRPLPRAVDGPWDWTGVARREALAPNTDRALTVSANWGVSAAPDRPGRLGRGGVWSVEAEQIERTYGPERTLHVSLEEFARTLTSTEENRERWREGGASSERIARKRGGAAFRRDAAEFHDAFRQFRCLDRANVLHLFQGFQPTPRFVREFPEAVEVGPLWPTEPARSVRRTPRTRPTEWLWYASPASSERLVAAVNLGLRGTGVSVVRLRSPRDMRPPANPSVRWSVVGPSGPSEWRKRFRASGLRIVTGSRTLLEALQVGGPFLYYNGTLGLGRQTHRHRPEKIQALLSAWESDGVSGSLRRDLDDFSRARRVEDVVRTAATDPAWRRAFPRRWRPSGFRRDRRDAGEFLVSVARSFAVGPVPSDELVRSVRAGTELPTEP